MLRSSLSASFLCLALLSGCSTLTTPDAETTPQATEAVQAERLLQQALQSQEPTRSQLLLQSAEQFLTEGRADRTLLALRQAQLSQLSIPEREQYLLLGAQANLQQGQGAEALRFLEQATPPLFSEASLQTQQLLSELRAEAYLISGDPLLSAIERVFVAGLLSGDEYNRNHELIWSALAQVSTDELQHALNESVEGDLKGWLALALALRRDIGLEQQLQSLRLWQQQYPLHPAARQLPGELQMLSSLSDQRPQRIALTLPLSGPLSSAGAAIRDGFLASYYADPQRLESSIQIDIFDTSASPSYLNLYHGITSVNHYDMIVGPLDKTAVAELESAQQLTVPVLALNYTDQALSRLSAPPAHSEETRQQPLVQFGLAIEDEIIQVTQRAWQDGHRRALVIVPASAWGQRALQTFQSQWQKQGGVILDSAQLGANQNYSAIIRDLLAVQESQRRTNELSRLIGENLKSQPSRRQDVDAIFLAAPSILARQVKPLLEFHYGGDLPVYATSQIFGGRTEPERDQDLNGVLFVDIPWALRQDIPIKTQMLDVWSDQAYDRLYALGVDAYQLLPRLALMARFPDSSLQGLTGKLQLSEGRQIRRQLDWAQIRSGRPRLEAPQSRENTTP